MQQYQMHPENEQQMMAKDLNANANNKMMDQQLHMNRLANQSNSAAFVPYSKQH